jgi:hypothetical protein
MKNNEGAMTRSSRTRTIFAAATSVLCLLAITAGLLLSYASRVLFNPQAFADRAAASLGEPGVAALVATRITDDIIRERRDLTAFRPIILVTTETIVSSGPFRAVVRRSAKVAHQTILSNTGEEISLSVTDVGLILQSALSASPELARKIPARVTALLAHSSEAPGGKMIVRLVRLARNLRIGAITLLLIGFSMGAVSFVLSTQRQRYLLRMGIALAIIALVLRLTVRFGGEFLGWLANDKLIGGALAGVWHAFLSGLMTWALILGGIGLVIAAGASAVFERVELLKIRDAVWTWLIQIHENKVARLIRAIVFLAIGMVAIALPSFTINVLALLTGLVVFFLGLRELFGVILLAIPHSQTAQTATSGGRRIPVARIIVVSILALLLAGAGVFYLRTHPAMIPHGIDACNGYPELCDRRVNEVVLPATHNSMSAADIPNWMFPEQETSMPMQLQDGIRGFLFDAHYGVPAGDRIKTLLDDEAAAKKKYEAVLGKEGVEAAMRIRDRLVGEKEGERGVYLCHGFCELGGTLLIPMLRQIREFLVMNPNEVIAFVIQDEGVTPKDIEKCFQESGLIDFVYRGPVGPPWPTLRTMIESDQRVMVFAENNSAGVSWYHQAYESMQETPYTFHKPEDFSCRPNRGPGNASLFLINHWIETAPAPKPSNAEIVNAYAFLLNRAQRCEQERHLLPNLLAVDFYKTGDLLKVAETLNGIQRPRVASAEQ